MFFVLIFSIVLILQGALLLGLFVLLFYGVFFLRNLKKNLNISNYSKLKSKALDNDGKNQYRIIRFLFYIATFFIPMLIVRPVAGTTLSDLIYFLCMAMTLFVMFNKRKIQYIKFPPLLMFGLILFMLGAIVSSLASGEVITSIAKAARLPFIILVWFWLCVILLNKEKYVYTTLKIWVASMAFNGLISVLQLKMEIPYTVNFYGRMTAFTGNISDLGAVTSIAFIPALVLATKKTKYTLLSYITMLLVGLGVIMSGSVSGLITVVVGTFIWLMIGRPSFRFLVVGSLLAVSLIVVMGIQESKGLVTPLSRIEASTSLNSSDSNATMMSRLVTYKAGLDEISHNPFIGVGFHGKETETGFGVHNIFLGALYQGGIFSFLGLLIICISILSLGYYNVKNSTTKLSVDISLALFISFICMLVFGMTGQFLYQRYAWITGALILPMYNIIKKENLDSYTNHTDKDVLSD